MKSYQILLADSSHEMVRHYDYKMTPELDVLASDWLKEDAQACRKYYSTQGTGVIVISRDIPFRVISTLRQNVDAMGMSIPTMKD